MLIQRIITSLILVALIAISVLCLSTYHFAVSLALIVLVGAWEWYDFTGYINLSGRIFYVLSTALMLAFIAYATPAGILLIAGIWWSVACMLVLTYPKSARFWQPAWVKLCIGWLVLVPAWYALCFLRVQDGGDELILYTLMVVGAADIGAFFGGRAFGRHHLAPQVSPGKTWEGVAGGVCAAMLVTLVASYHWSLDLHNLIGFVLLTILLSVMSVFGDLLESMFKRARGIKDSGKILPGHGGVLDRIDSITAAAPIFVLLLPVFIAVN